MMNNYLKTMMEFKGYGNPDGKYWFIGMEEALSITNKSELESYSDNDGLYFNCIGQYEDDKKKFYADKEGKSNYTSVYDIMGKIMMGVEESEGDLTEFLNKNLFVNGGNNFYTPLFPLGKARVDQPLPEQTIKLFGLDGMKHYQDMVELVRFPFLHDLWNKKDDKITICFGKGYWGYFKMAMGLEKSKSKEIENGNILYYPEANTYLVPFFWYGNNGIGKYIEPLCKHIKNCK